MPYDLGSILIGAGGFGTGIAAFITAIRTGKSNQQQIKENRDINAQVTLAIIGELGTCHDERKADREAYANTLSALKTHIIALEKGWDRRERDIPVARERRTQLPDLDAIEEQLQGRGTAGDGESLRQRLWDSYTQSLRDGPT